MYIEASGKLSGQRARFVSGVFQPPERSDNISRCLTFYYHMYGSEMGQLEIYLEFIAGRRLLVWERSGNQGKEWHHGMVAFASFSTHKV